MSKIEIFEVDGNYFHYAIDPRTNTPAIVGIHPYDLTEYHYARKSPDGSGLWLYRNGKGIVVNFAPADTSRYDVARHLMKLDAAAGLSPKYDPYDTI